MADTNITTINIFAAMADVIRSEFGSNTEVNDQDTQEGFSQDSFFIEMVTSTLDDISEESTAETLVMRVDYIPETEKDTAAYLGVKQKLQQIFHRTFKLTDDYYIYITRQEFSATKNNGLEMMIDFYYNNREAEDAGVLLDTLAIELNKNEGGN